MMLAENLRNFAEINLATLNQNLGSLHASVHALSPQCVGMVPMVKANAYGHGLVIVAKALEKNPLTLALGVACFDEAFELRAAGVRKEVWLFSDALELSEDWINQAIKHQLVPIIYSIEKLKLLTRLLKHKKAKSRFRIHLKWNTGLNRLGIEPSLAEEVRTILKKNFDCIELYGISSHFAESESPRSNLTHQQKEKFSSIVKTFSALRPQYVHVSNSGAVLNENYLKMMKYCNAARPGIGLYGYCDDHIIPSQRNILKPVLSWKAKILQKRILKKGDRVGYGGVWKAQQQTQQSILAIGYGDGFPRALSNQSLLLSSNSRGRLKTTPVLGRVSMDLTAIQSDHLSTNVGDYVQILGSNHEQGNWMCKQSKKIIYEILTGISDRVPRIYIK